MAQQLDLTDDQIDVRDLIARVEHLEQLEQPGSVDLGPEDADLFAELATLRGILEDLRGNGGDEDWRGDWYPLTLIRDSYFESAMDELLEDIGTLPKDLPSYLTVTIDYDALQMDYTSTEIDGTTYWYR
jgi:hypothetical protein